MQRIRSLLSALFARLGLRRAPAAAGARGLTARQGLWGEREAERELLREEEARKDGLRVVGRRVRVGRDEIDLVLERPARKDGPGRLLVFVEVKTRSSEAFGGGRAAMTARKRHALCRAVLHYLRREPPTPFRIDLVEVYGDAAVDRLDRVVHHRNAVPMERRFDAPALARPRCRRRSP